MSHNLQIILERTSNYQCRDEYTLISVNGELVARPPPSNSGRQVVYTILKKIRVGVEGLMANARFSCQVGSGDLTSSERVKPMRLAP